MRLLLVEDNRDLARWLAEILRGSRYAVDVAHDGVEAEDCLRAVAYDAVILDLALPRVDGLEVLRRLRARRSKVPVIILTADSGLKSRVVGLDEGADDYLTKPFDVEELEARIRSQLRRSSGHGASVINCGDLALDTLSHTYTLSGRPLALSPRESGVLEQLIRRQGRTSSKVALAETLFGFGDDADPSAIEIYVHRLRKKLDGSSVTIATLRGLGYILRPSAG